MFSGINQQQKTNQGTSLAAGTALSSGAGAGAYQYLANNPLKGGKADKFIKSAAKSVTMKDELGKTEKYISNMRNLAFVDGRVVGAEPILDTLTKQGPKMKVAAERFLEEIASIKDEEGLQKYIGNETALDIEFRNNLLDGKTFEGLTQRTKNLQLQAQNIQTIGAGLTENNFKKVLSANNEIFGISNIDALSLDSAKKLVDNKVISLNMKAASNERSISMIEDFAEENLGNIWNGKKFTKLAKDATEEMKEFASGVKNAASKVGWKNAAKTGAVAALIVSQLTKKNPSQDK